jgi:hypothetical protein
VMKRSIFASISAFLRGCAVVSFSLLGVGFLPTCDGMTILSVFFRADIIVPSAGYLDFAVFSFVEKFLTGRRQPGLVPLGVAKES